MTSLSHADLWPFMVLDVSNRAVLDPEKSTAVAKSGESGPGYKRNSNR